MGETEVIEKLKGVPQLLAATRRARRAAGIQTALEVVNKEGKAASLSPAPRLISISYFADSLPC
ncbi:hypothetical protein E2C01_070278 [Portunus trituberculatus]|uniref:Uncharacterized protein n=1 Tax=Portunus trituberculatus TaxID=210409 RepID=A0A5B7HS97_PORTR|nr:hypothetical protein [Portunus trituberculatus]